MNRQYRMISNPDWASEQALFDARTTRRQSQIEQRQTPCHAAARSSQRTRSWAKQFALSEHASQRAAQRGLSLTDVRYVLRYGERLYAADAVIYYLRRIDIPADHQPMMCRLEGTAVFIAKNHPCIITVWRNRQHGMRNLHRKLRNVWYQESGEIG